VTKEELWWKIFDCPYKGKCNIPKGIFPAPFFVGDNYERVANKVLFIAQNPGWPNDKDTDYNYIYENIPKFKNRFDLLMQAIAWELRVDKIWQGMIKSGIEAKLEDIAFTNLVKCATENNKFPDDKMVEKCAKHLDNEISILRPQCIVFTGKTAHDTYKEYKGKYYGFLGNINIKWLYHTSMPVWQKKNREVRRKEITYINDSLKNKYWR